jgi:hypothetical protein
VLARSARDPQELAADQQVVVRRRDVHVTVPKRLPVDRIGHRQHPLSATGSPHCARQLGAPMDRDQDGGPEAGAACRAGDATEPRAHRQEPPITTRSRPAMSQHGRPPCTTVNVRIGHTANRPRHPRQRLAFPLTALPRSAMRGMETPGGNARPDRRGSYRQPGMLGMLFQAWGFEVVLAIDGEHGHRARNHMADPTSSCSTSDCRASRGERSR